MNGKIAYNVLEIIAPPQLRFYPASYKENSSFLSLSAERSKLFNRLIPKMLGRILSEWHRVCFCLVMYPCGNRTEMRPKRAVSKTLCRGCAGYGLAKEIAIIIPFILLFAGQSAAEPQAKLEAHSPTVPRNGRLRVALELVWAGEADLYDIPRPDLSDIPDFDVLEIEIFTERRGDENRLRYSLALEPMKEGEYDLGQMKVEYFEKGQDVATAIELPQTIIKVTGPALIGRKGKLAVAVGAVLIACAAAAGSILRSRERTRKTSRDDLAAKRHTREGLLAELDAARRFRIEGETGTYLDTLCMLAASESLKPHTRNTEELNELKENVKFGDLTPSPDQLDGAEKSIRNAIREAFPNGDEAEPE